MPKIHFRVSSDTLSAFHKEPWKHASKLDQPRPIPGYKFKAIEEDVFKTPNGVYEKDIKFQIVTAPFRETTLSEEYGSARMIEVHHFVMQPVSIFIILPKSDMATLEEFKLREMKTVIADAVERLEERLVRVAIPLPIYKKIGKARMKDKYIARLAERSAALKQQQSSSKDPPLGEDFQVNGPCVVLLYDHVKSFVLCSSAVHRFHKSLREVEDSITKLKRCDEVLVKQKLSHENESYAEKRVQGATSKPEERKFDEKIDCKQVNNVLKAKSAVADRRATNADHSAADEEEERSVFDYNEAAEEEAVLMKQLGFESAKRPAKAAAGASIEGAQTATAEEAQVAVTEVAKSEVALVQEAQMETTKGLAVGSTEEPKLAIMEAVEAELFKEVEVAPVQEREVASVEQHEMAIVDEAQVAPVEEADVALTESHEIALAEEPEVAPNNEAEVAPIEEAEAEHVYTADVALYEPVEKVPEAVEIPNGVAPVEEVPAASTVVPDVAPIDETEMVAVEVVRANIRGAATEVLPEAAAIDKAQVPDGAGAVAATVETAASQQLHNDVVVAKSPRRRRVNFHHRADCPNLLRKKQSKQLAEAQ